MTTEHGRVVDESALPITWDTPMIGASKLRELIDTWRTRAALQHTSSTLASAVTEHVYLECSKELEALLDA